jgi:hypothetical protein
MTMNSQDCSFDIINAEKGICKVLGTQDCGTHAYTDPPAPFMKDEEVTFTGKWPLQSYLDNEKEEFSFHRVDGSTVTGVLIGFTIDCTSPYMHKLGIPRLRIRIPVTKVDGSVVAV